jgi:nitrate reductase cytochrome c-type subunit
MEVKQLSGQTAFICDERCPLAKSNNIDAARQWAEQPPMLESETTGVTMTDKNDALGCLSMMKRGVCQAIAKTNQQP